MRHSLLERRKLQRVRRLLGRLACVPENHTLDFCWDAAAIRKRLDYQVADVEDVDVGQYSAQGVVLNQRDKVIAADGEPRFEFPEPAVGTQVCKDGLPCIPTLLRVGLDLIGD